MGKKAGAAAHRSGLGSKTGQPGAHDMGGERAGPVDHHEHTPTLTERRIDAMMLLLRNAPRSFWVTDENRRTIESLAPETYAASGYYEKWTYAMRSLLIEKGVLSRAIIDRRLAEVKARPRSAGPSQPGVHAPASPRLRTGGKTPRAGESPRSPAPAAAKARPAKDLRPGPAAPKGRTSARSSRSRSR